jgi:hypothetical protein
LLLGSVVEELLKTANKSRDLKLCPASQEKALYWFARHFLFT